MWVGAPQRDFGNDASGGRVYCLLDMELSACEACWAAAHRGSSAAHRGSSHFRQASPSRGHICVFEARFRLASSACTAHLQEFLASGTQEVQKVMAMCKSIQVGHPRGTESDSHVQEHSGGAPRRYRK